MYTRDIISETVAYPQVVNKKRQKSTKAIRCRKCNKLIGFLL